MPQPTRSKFFNQKPSSNPGWVPILSLSVPLWCQFFLFWRGKFPTLGGGATSWLCEWASNLETWHGVSSTHDMKLKPFWCKNSCKEQINLSCVWFQKSAFVQQMENQLLVVLSTVQKFRRFLQSRNHEGSNQKVHWKQRSKFWNSRVWFCVLLLLITAKKSWSSSCEQTLWYFLRCLCFANKARMPRSIVSCLAATAGCKACKNVLPGEKILTRIRKVLKMIWNIQKWHKKQGKERKLQKNCMSCIETINISGGGGRGG